MIGALPDSTDGLLRAHAPQTETAINATSPMVMEYLANNADSGRLATVSRDDSVWFICVLQCATREG